jgi:hypothetical protein
MHHQNDDNPAFAIKKKSSDLLAMDAVECYCDSFRSYLMLWVRQARIGSMSETGMSAKVEVKASMP